MSETCNGSYRHVPLKYAFVLQPPLQLESSHKIKRQEGLLPHHKSTPLYRFVQYRPQPIYMHVFLILPFHEPLGLVDGFFFSSHVSPVYPTCTVSDWSIATSVLA